MPLPYCQLLKIVNLCWVFSLPFVLANEMQGFLPVIMLLASVAFFGLDQVGAELEGPYGVDDNDFPLLHMGISLVDDLDVMLRNACQVAELPSHREVGTPAAFSQEARGSVVA